MSPSRPAAKAKARAKPAAKPKARAKPAAGRGPAKAAPADPFAALDAATSAALDAAENALRSGKTAEVSDEAVQRLLTAGAKLYAVKLELEDRYFAPFVSQESVTATEVVTNVCEFLRAADLNMFDLAMWFRRPRPGDR
jgi:hypothetical protein